MFGIVEIVVLGQNRGSSIQKDDILILVKITIVFKFGMVEILVFMSES